MTPLEELVLMRKQVMFDADEFIPAIVMVDADPRWMHGLSDTSDETRLMLLLNDRVHRFLFWCEMDRRPTLPVLAFHSDTYALYDLSRLEGRAVALTGLYGGECVYAADVFLQRQGIETVLLRDLILWGWGVEPEGQMTADVFPAYAEYEGWLSEPENRHDLRIGWTVRALREAMDRQARLSVGASGV